MQDIQQDHSHTPEAIRDRLAAGPRGGYLREWVYGGIDGTVTTFAIVAGVVGAGLSPVIILILGLANLLGDGFSMAAGAYSSARAEADNYERLRQVEDRHIDIYPEGEVEEIRQIYAAKGLSGDDLERVVATITADRDLWVATMMAEEYGLSPLLPPPLKVAIHTFAAFCLCGAMPLFPFLFDLPQSFTVSLALSALTFFGIGSFRSFWSVHSWWRSGGETFLIGITAAGIAFLVGYMLRGLGF